MAPRSAIALAFCLAGCAETSPSRAHVADASISTRTATESRADASLQLTEASHEVFSAAPGKTEDQYDHDASVTPLLPPDDAICFIHGFGDPFSNRCGSFSVTRGKDGSSPVGTFRSFDIDATWAFFRGKGRSWVGLRSAGIALTGFVDANAQRFRLTRPIAAIEGHVWFDEGAPVVVRQGTEHGIKVAVDGDTPGVESLTAEIGCDALAFDPISAADRRSLRALNHPRPKRWAAPRRSALPLRIEPHGRIVMTLRRDDEPLPISVDVREVEGSYSRVVFDTESVHFDVWVGSSELTTQGGRGIGGSSGSCGRSSRDYSKAALFDVQGETPIVIAAKPGAAALGAGDVSIAAGSRVVVRRREHGFAEIVAPFSAIDPPGGTSFWVPEIALREHAVLPY